MTHVCLEYLHNHFNGYAEKGLIGFTIGNGKKIYYYISPTIYQRTYRCLPIEGEKLGWPRYCYPSQEVNIIMNPRQERRR